MPLFKRKQQSPELLEFLAETDEVAARRIRAEAGGDAEQESVARSFEGRARSRRQAAKRRRDGGQ
jgi:hypothetical protein